MIGLSLPLTYLADSPAASPAGRAWREALGDPVAGLAALRAAGVTSVELRSVGRGTDPALALQAACRVRDAGLALTIHGHLPSPAQGEIFAELCPSLAPLARVLSAWGSESVMTVHSHSAVGIAAEELADSSVQALRIVVAALEDERIPLRIALENDRLRERASPGVSYDGILAIIDRVGSPRVGACWDFGHAYANVQQGRLEVVPPAGFLRRVIHTHIHDLGPATHHPLTLGVVPLELFLDRLLAAGYGGLFNLELSPARFEGGPVRDLVYASIERLAGYLRHHANDKETGGAHAQPGLCSNP